MNIKKPIKKLGKFLQPNIQIGGLDISDAALLYSVIGDDEKKVEQASVRLPIGIVVGGKIKNKRHFIQALRVLHHQITPYNNRQVAVVVSVSDAAVYTQPFSLPPVGEEGKQEALRLNIQTISPLEFSKVYADYERVSSDDDVSEEYLASFSEKEFINELFKCLTEANFTPVAIEQRALSVTRTVGRLGTTLDQGAAYLVLYIGSDGLSFSLMRKGLLYFNRFILWGLVSKMAEEKRQILYKDFRNAIVQESNRVISYYANRFSEPIKAIYVIAPGLEEYVNKILRSSFSYPIEELILRQYDINYTWLGSFGSALRGTVPRSEDEDINIAPQGTQQRFMHSQILAFIGFWRAILITVSIVLVGMYSGSLAILNQQLENIAQSVATLSVNSNTTRVTQLRQEAALFNQTADRVVKVYGQQTRWVNLITSIQSQVKSPLYITRLQLQSPSSPLVISGRAANENQALALKEQLQLISALGTIDLPFTDIKQLSANEVSFRMSAPVRNLKF